MKIGVVQGQNELNFENLRKLQVENYTNTIVLICIKNIIFQDITFTI
jgi:hypothetical protein